MSAVRPLALSAPHCSDRCPLSLVKPSVPPLSAPSLPKSPHWSLWPCAPPYRNCCLLGYLRPPHGHTCVFSYSPCLPLGWRAGEAAARRAPPPAFWFRGLSKSQVMLMSEGPTRPQVAPDGPLRAAVVRVWYASQAPCRPVEAYFSDLTCRTDRLLSLTVVCRAVPTFAPLAPLFLGALSLPSYAWTTPTHLFFKGWLSSDVAHFVKWAVPPVAVGIKRFSFRSPYLQEKISHLFIQSPIS